MEHQIIYVVLHGYIKTYLLVKETPKGVHVCNYKGGVTFFKQNNKVYARNLGEPIEYHTQRIVYTHDEAVVMACLQIESLKNYHLSQITVLDNRKKEL